jgi:hypothetical protein
MLPIYSQGTDCNVIVLYELPRTIQHMLRSEFIEQNVARLYTQPLFRILYIFTLNRENALNFLLFCLAHGFPC